MDITEIFDEYQVDYKEHGEHHHTTSGWLQLDCPWCSPSTGNYRLGYNLNRGYFSCWNCGPSNLYETLVSVTGAPPKVVYDLIREITRHAPVEFARRGKLLIPPGVKPMLDWHKDYIRNRDLDPDKIEKFWHVQGFGLTDKYAWRLWIPIHYRSDVVSWTTRSTSRNTTAHRYIAAPLGSEAISAKDILYGEDYVNNVILVHEGAIDVWAVGPGATATMGTGYTQAQVRRIAKYPKRIICFDSVPDAQKRARELCKSLEVFHGKTVNVVLDAKDAASAGPDEIRKLRKLLKG